MAAHTKIILSLALLAALCPAPGAAEVPLSPALPPEPAPGAAESPWSVGVSKAKRQQAEVLFKEGNAFLRESVFVAAAAKYREALELWDHPNIRYNLALAVMNLDQPLEMYDHLQGAIRFGADPLGKERFEHAKNYLVLLEKQVARVHVRCTTPGASIDMDGKLLFKTPGEYQGLVRPGMHTLVARREGFVTNNTVRMVEGGKTTEILLELKTRDDLTQTEHRWPNWIPWTVLGAGAAVAIGGGALHYSASQKVDSINSQSKALCPTGCPSEPANLASMRTQAASMQKMAIGAYAVGGAAVVVGGALVLMNRARVVTRTYDSDTAVQPPRASLEVTPVLAAGGFGLSAAGRF